MTNEKREFIAATIGLLLVVAGLVVAILTFEVTTIVSLLGALVPMTIGAFVLMFRHGIVAYLFHDSETAISDGPIS